MNEYRNQEVQYNKKTPQINIFNYEEAILSLLQYLRGRFLEWQTKPDIRDEISYFKEEPDYFTIAFFKAMNDNNIQSNIQAMKQVLDYCFCPMTGYWIIDPVSMSDGYIYEKNIIKLFIKKGNHISPVTGKKFPHFDFTSNPLAKKCLEILRNNSLRIPDEALVHAVYSENIFELELLLKLGGCVNAKNKYRQRLLWIAVEKNNSRMIQLLVRYGADISYICEYKNITPLYFIIKFGCLVTLKALIQYLGFSINEINIKKINNGLSFLHLAVIEDQFEISQWLIKKGASINKKDNQGLTALHYAAAKGCLSFVKFLVEHGALINEKCQEYTPLHTAAAFGRLEVIPYLYKIYDSVQETDEGPTPLYVAVEHRQLDVIELILKLDPTSLYKTSAGFHTVLHLAAVKDYLKIIAYLLDKDGLALIQIKNANGQTALHVAAEKNNWRTVDLMLNKGFSAHEKDNEGRTALHLAAQYGHQETLQCLLHYSKNSLHKEDKDGNTPFLLAVTENYLDCVHILVEHGASLNDKNYLGNTALHLAVQGNRLPTVQWLMKRGASLHEKNSFGENPQKIAFRLNHKKIIHFFKTYLREKYFGSNQVLIKVIKAKNYSELQLLLSFGCNVDEKDERGYTALHYAAGIGCLEAVLSLMDHGAWVNEIDSRGYTPLHLAAARGHTEVMLYLLDGGALLLGSEEAADKIPLHLAAFNGQLEVVELLIELDPISIYRKTNNQNTALHLAASKDQVDVVRHLLERAPELSEEKNFSGETALHIAAVRNHSKTVDFLLKHGVFPHAKNNARMTSLFLAVNNHHKETIRVFKQYFRNFLNTEDESGYTPLYIAAIKGDVKAIGDIEDLLLLIKLGLVLNVTNRNGQTPIHLAAKYGHKKILDFLKQLGISIHIPDDYGNTALHEAIARPKTLFSLLKKGASPNQKNDEGLTPLHLAVMNNEKLSVVYLIQDGALIDAKDNKGDTPLHKAMASSLNNIEILECLLHFGASITLKNNRGDTPLHIATRLRHEALISFLLEHGADRKAPNQENETPIGIAKKSGNVKIQKLFDSNQENSYQGIITKIQFEDNNTPNRQVNRFSFHSSTSRNSDEDISEDDENKKGIEMGYLKKQALVLQTI